MREFELVQAGFDVRTDGPRHGQERLRRLPKQQPPPPPPSEKKRPTPLAATSTAVALAPSRCGGEKRKFELGRDDIERVAHEDRARARRAIDEDEKAAKPSLPFFWVPSVTPSSNKNDVLHEVKKKTKSVARVSGLPGRPARTASRCTRWSP